MNGFLVRVGIDQSFGGWNAPVDPATNEFFYVPIPESQRATFHPGCRRPYSDLLSELKRFCTRSEAGRLPTFPEENAARNMHLDPDFEFLTYGDDGSRRGSRIKKLGNGDLLVFYAGLRPTSTCEHRLVYAIIGVFIVDAVIPLPHVSRSAWRQNAHTRKVDHAPDDIVVRAKRAVSGRLSRCLPIGEFRAGAYRVRPELLKAWGGLSVSDGFIQRSAVPPRFGNAKRFYEWFLKENVQLLERNN